MPAGRPRHFDAPDEMQDQIDAYFDQDDMPTMAGLCNFLGMSRQSFSDYQKRDEFSDITKAARQRVEAHVERLLLYGKAATGAIFWLKNHAGYVDRTEQDATVRGNFTISDKPLEPDEWDEQYGE